MIHDIMHDVVSMILFFYSNFMHSCAYSIVLLAMFIASRILFKLKQETQTSNFFHASMPRLVGFDGEVLQSVHTT